MIASLRRRRWSLAWLLAIVALGVVLAWLASVPLLRGEPDGRIGSRVGEPAPELALTDLGVNWGEEQAGVEDFVARYGVTYPILLDPGLETYYRWAGTDGLPRHYFIGAEGTVLREIVGPLDPARMVGVVEELLAS